VLFELGCGYGKCMDGGGSASLVVDGELINTPAGGEERPVADFLYFTD
jgi:exopolysaccharide biosynthesis protein